jgi:hypothetical protein
MHCFGGLGLKYYVCFSGSWKKIAKKTTRTKKELYNENKKRILKVDLL